MAPIARGISDREKNQLIFLLRPFHCFIAPRIPLHGVMRMEQQIRTGLMDESIRPLPRAVWILECGLIGTRNPRKIKKHQIYDKFLCCIFHTGNLCCEMQRAMNRTTTNLCFFLKSNPRRMIIAQVPVVLRCARVPLGLTAFPLAKHNGCSRRILRLVLQMRDPNGDAHEGVLPLTLPQPPGVPRD